MANLKNSIAFLFFYLILVFGVAQVNYIEQNILNFEPAFFVLVALAVLIGIYLPSISRISIYTYLLFWALIYGLVWLFYWRTLEHPSNIQTLGIQFILVTISAGLAFDVGQHLRAMNVLFEGLSVTTYPNRALEIRQAESRISAELTRSRRYRHPLSLLLVELKKNRSKGKSESLDGLQRDLLHHFAIARVGQVIGESARETDLILRDQNGRFILLCPETDFEHSIIFGERIRQAVAENMDAEVVWSSASFPDEALTFEELIERAEQRLSQQSVETAASLPIKVEDKLNHTKSA